MKLKSIKEYIKKEKEKEEEKNYKNVELKSKREKKINVISVLYLRSSQRGPR